MLWRQTISEIMRGDPEENRSSSWPIFLFLGILFATPYLIHRLVNNNTTSQINSMYFLNLSQIDRINSFKFI